MLKIGKGLKKKIKGKKEHKEEDLFDPENLAKYKKELEESRAKETTSEAPPPSEENEEWLRFKQLTQKVDSTLKNSSGDLDRIKTSSYFQKKASASLVEEHIKHWENPEEEDSSTTKEDFDFPTTQAHDSNFQKVEENQTAAFDLKPQEVDEEVYNIDDCLFDTSYTDAIESGQIQLAYIPDSPIDKEPEGDDPFDTSCVNEVVKKIEEAEKKEKRKVNLGSTVEFLTHKVETPHSSTNKKNKRHKRQVYTDLLGFDEDELSENSEKVEKESDLKVKGEIVGESGVDLKDLLREFEENNYCDIPVLSISNVNLLTEETCQKEILAEDEIDPFDTSIVETIGIGKKELQKLEEELLAHSPNLEKKVNPIEEKIYKSISESNKNNKLSLDDFNFDPRSGEEKEQIDHIDSFLTADNSEHLLPTSLELNEEIDPFDTTGVSDAILPGKLELKNLEDEFITPIVTNFSTNFDYIEEFNPILKREDSEHPLEKIDECLAEVLQPPLLNTKKSPQSPVEISFEDPFDTSGVIDAFAPGKSELKELESELLQTTTDYIPQKTPLEFKILSSTISAPTTTQNFTHKIKEREESIHPLDAVDSLEETGLIPLGLVPETEKTFNKFEIDPFDTSAAEGIGPGRIEAKLLEEELKSASFDFPTNHPLVEQHQEAYKISSAINLKNQEDIDPFDTSFFN